MEHVKRRVHRPGRTNGFGGGIMTSMMGDLLLEEVEDNPWPQGYSMLTGVRRMGGQGGTCHLCRQRDSNRTCVICGNRVCSACFTMGANYCDDCMM